VGKKMFLLIDRATWHRSTKAKEFYQNNKQWLKISFFPTATPDRNPTEYCWKTTREDLTSIKSFKNIKVLNLPFKEMRFLPKFSLKIGIKRLFIFALIVDPN
jgi:putative transposase